MKIGFDLDSLTLRSGGIGRYGVNLINHLAKILLTETDHEIFVFFHRSFDRSFLPAQENLELVNKYTRIKSNVLRKAVFLPFSIRNLKMDLFHGVDHIGLPFLYRSKTCQYVVTIHDLITRIYPRSFPIKQRLIQNTLLPLILSKAERIIVDSRSTENDVQKFYSQQVEKVRVIYPGVESLFYPRSQKEVERVLDKYQLDFKYYFFLGTLEPRKNIVRLIEAFIKLKRKRNVEHRLVISGRKGWLYKEIMEKIKHSPFSQDIIFTDFVDDQDLPYLFSGAEMFLYPSLYEGFGLPVLEAMACGTPVIASNLSSLPEITGEAGILVDPMNIEEIALAMEELSEDRKLQEELRKKGLERAKLFSWEKAAQETKELYQEMLG
ncbi:MAG: glycosyltransferase [Candidatus Aminicenantes bacterium]|nr:glycosyltransferase [Candidatus Aminicenantes bacterium]